jgi:hypothetical protein
LIELEAIPGQLYTGEKTPDISRIKSVMGLEFIEGNEAIARGALKANCDFFAGYRSRHHHRFCIIC